MAGRRVVVTGLGLLTPVGNTVNTSWSAILEGRSGVTRLDWDQASALPTRIAAQIKNFDPSLSIDRRRRRVV